MPLTWSSCSTEERPPWLSPEFDDLLSRDRADSVDRVKLLDARAAEAYRAVFGAGAGGGGRGSSRPAGREDDLLSVREVRRPVYRLDNGAPPGPAGAPDRVNDARPCRQAVDPRAPHRARYIDDDVAAAPAEPEAPGRSGRRRGGRCPPAAALGAYCPSADQKQRDRHSAIDEDLGAGEIRHGSSIRDRPAPVARAINRFRYRSSSSS
jgi:hypothetical protein